MENIIFCADCNKKIDNEDYLNDKGEPICESCHNDYCYCEDCNDTIRISDGIWVNRDEHYICNNCYINNYFTCDNCEEVIHNDYYGHNGLCQNCEDNHDNDDEYYRTTSNKKIVAINPQTKEKIRGDILPTMRTFGVELEFAHDDDLYEFATYLPKTCGLVADGSVDNGDELNTPPLEGKAGEKYIKQVCEVLENNEAYINKSCGFHLHLEARDYLAKPEDLRKLLIAYISIEPLLLAMVPKSRRGNGYCLPVGDYLNITDCERTETIDKLEELWYKTSDKNVINDKKSGKYDGTRYNGLNLHALLHNNKTIEVRYHSGTINAKKVLNWVALHQAIFELVKNRRTFNDNMKKIRLEPELKKKWQTLKKELQLLLKPETIDYFTERLKKFSKDDFNEEDYQVNDNQKELCAE